MNQILCAIRSLFVPRQISRDQAFAIAQPEFERIGFGQVHVPVATLTWGRWWVRRGPHHRLGRVAEVMVDAVTGAILSVRVYDDHRRVEPDGIQNPRDA